MDDQFIILDKLRDFFGFRTPFWNVNYAGSGEEALEIIRENPPEVIVADSSMPGMDGNELLQKVKELHPSMFRILLSSECSVTDVVNAVGVAHQRLGKPIQMEELMNTLEMSRSLYNQIKDSRIQKIIEEFDGLPVPRESYFTITQLLKDPNVDIEDVAEVIRKDAIISAHVLRLVNSVMLGRAQRVDSISQAVMTLGMNAIQSLVLMIGLLVDQGKNEDGVLNVEAFSRHSLEVANHSKSIAKAMGMSASDQDLAFTTGLLQNIGKFVLADLFIEKYWDHGTTEDPYDSFMLYEGMDEPTLAHPLIGASLLAVWGMSGKIVNAVAYHHDPQALDGALMGVTMPVHIAEGFVNYQSKKEAGLDLFDSGMVETELIEDLGLREVVSEYLQIHSES